MIDERFWDGIRSFNNRDFFEAHEILEDLWHEYRESDRTFLQALIQISAGLYHADAGNVRGAKSQVSKGREKLRSYAPAHRGVDVQSLLEESASCLVTLEAMKAGQTIVSIETFFPQIKLIPELSQESGMHHGNNDH